MADSRTGPAGVDAIANEFVARLERRRREESSLHAQSGSRPENSQDDEELGTVETGTEEPGRDFAWWLAACGVPPRYCRVTSNWPLPHALRSWLGDPWSVTLLGATGTGKTSLAVAMLGRVAAELGDGLFVTGPGLIRMALEDIRGRGVRNVERSIETAVLVLDDFGSERNTEFAASEVSAVLCARYDHVRPTIVTSNLNLDDLEPRIASRLASGIVIRLEGRDWRLSQSTATATRDDSDDQRD